MKIDRTAWHTRIYLWWYGHKYSSYEAVDKKVSNLCPYMRVVMFWAPLRFVFSTWVELFEIRGVTVSLNFLTIPVLLWIAPILAGYANYNLKMCLWLMYLSLVCIAAGLAFLFGIAYLFASDGKNLAGPLCKAVKTSSFVSLFQEYLRSAHDRVCPEVEFAAGNKEQQ